MRNTAKGDVWYYGRIIAVVKGERGIELVLSGAALVPGIASAEDVGVKADLGGMLATFQFAGK